MKKIITFLSLLLFATMISTAQNEKIVKFYDTKAGSGHHSVGDDFAYIGDSIMIFQMWNDDSGYELWRTNGTAIGTYMIKDILPELDYYETPISSSPEYFCSFKDKVYFRAADGVHGFELWCTDGTEAGTYMVKDIFAGGAGALNPTYPIFCEYKNELYFSAKESSNSGSELWKTNGTEEGTVLVKDISPNNKEHSNPQHFIVFNDLLFFTAKTNNNSNDIWYTDGTADGTMRLSNLPAGQRPTTSVEMKVFNDMLIFRGTSNHLWKTDGTANGTMEINDSIEISMDEMVELNDRLYFKGRTEGLGYELWATDGTEAGTVLVKDINPGMNGSYPYSSTPTSLCVFDNKVFFAARNEDSGTQLWASDGTNEGTVLFYGHHDDGTWGPGNLIHFNQRFYFTLATSTLGQPYLYSIGSGNETPIAHQPLDFSFMTSGGHYGTFFTLNNTLCFQAELEDNTGFELYKLIDDTENPSCSLNKLPKPTGYTEICANINVNLYSTVNTNTEAAVQWVLEPASAGQLSGTGNDVSIEWDLSHIGSVKLWAYLTKGECTGNNSDTLMIERIALPEKPVIAPKGDLLISTSAAGYQWYRRVGSSASGYLDPIPGATEKSYSPTENGVYAVQTSNAANCTTLSDDYQFVSTSITDTKKLNFSILPNPCYGKCTIKFPGQTSTMQVKIYNSQGSLIAHHSSINEEKELSFTQKGLYIIEVITDDTYYSQKLLVE